MPRRADRRRPARGPRDGSSPKPGDRRNGTTPLRRDATTPLPDRFHAPRTFQPSLLDMAPIGYVTLSESGVVQAMNITSATLLGQMRAYLTGVPFALNLAHEDRRRFEEYLHGCRQAAGTAVTIDVTLLGSTQVGEVPAHLITRLVEGKNGVSALLMAVIDQRERTESIAALEESSRRLRRIAAALEERTSKAEEATHRLRGLAREVNRAEQRERQRIARLLHDDLQQLLVSAKMRLRMGPPGQPSAAQIDAVGELIDAAINSSRLLTAQISPPLLQDAGLEAGLKWLARFMQEHHQLAVELELGLGGDPIDFSDRDFLFQAAREMLFNVVKHARTKTAHLAARVRQREVTLDVIDAGRGFDVRSLEHDGAEGTGLRTLKERVQLLGGSFRVDSTPGRGTRVRLSYALSEAEPAEERGMPQRAEFPERATLPDGRVRVLIADDHRVVREGIQSFLSQEEWLEVVGQASDGRQAVLMTRALQPDVVIMDISMPELNGIEATRIITGENPRVRIIGMSMHQQEDMASAMMSAGAERYLTKGGPAEDLVRAVRELGHPSREAVTGGPSREAVAGGPDSPRVPGGPPREAVTGGHPSPNNGRASRAARGGLRKAPGGPASDPQS